MGLKSAIMLFCNVEKGNFHHFYAAHFYSVGQNKVLSQQLKTRLRGFIEDWAPPEFKPVNL